MRLKDDGPSSFGFGLESVVDDGHGAVEIDARVAARRFRRRHRRRRRRFAVAHRLQHPLQGVAVDIH